MKKLNLTLWDMLVGTMLTIVVGIMPLIVRFAFRPIPPELISLRQSLAQEFAGAGLGAVYPDVLSYWKSLFILVPAAIIVIYVISDLATRGKVPDFKGFFKRPQVIISLVYLLLMLISALASPYTSTSWFGTMERAEGAFMWLAYFTVFFAAMSFVREPRFAKPILFGLIFSSIVMGAIGVSQFMGRDFFDTAFASWLVTVGTDAEGIGAVFSMAHGTLYNPNTFGKYTAMLSPLLLIAALTYDGKKYVNICLFIAGALMLLGVFGSSSLGGLVGIVTAVIVLTVTYVWGLIYRRRTGATIQFFGISAKWLMIACGGIIVAVALAILLVPQLNYRVTFLFNRMSDAMRAETATIQNYHFDGDTMIVTRGDETQLSLTVHGLNMENWLTIRDHSGNIVPYASREVIVQEVSPEQQVEVINYIFDVPGYRRIFIEKQPAGFIYYHQRPIPFWLTFREGRIFGVFIHDNSLIDFAEEVPAWGFYGRETWGSNRGHIWSRTFPMMPGRIFLGSGPDAYVNVFPQHDIVANHRFHNHAYIVIDKAHNLFLQTWITTGGISAIALFGLFGHYLFTTFLSLLKSKGEPLFSYGLRLGTLTAVSAFVMSSMATDSTVGSTGVFFVILGMGYGLNAFTKSLQTAPQ
ncbi:MAG: O-antigen ligase family protein [Defluviitaleaceae bacterium]|nr:O-antigen ligase family protein [Defluviitaleaceae bacterium]